MLILTDVYPYLKDEIFVIINKNKNNSTTNKQITMMKSFTIAAAALACSAMAGRNPKLSISYEDTDDYFLGLREGQTLTLKEPKDFSADARDGLCSGWVRQVPAEGYNDFVINAITEGC